MISQLAKYSVYLYYVWIVLFRYAKGLLPDYYFSPTICCLLILFWGNERSNFGTCCIPIYYLYFLHYIPTLAIHCIYLLWKLWINLLKIVKPWFFRCQIHTEENMIHCNDLFCRPTISPQIMGVMCKTDPSVKNVMIYWHIFGRNDGLVLH